MINSDQAHILIHVYLNLYFYACMYVCSAEVSRFIYSCFSSYKIVSPYACMSVCMYVRMFVACLYVCMYIYLHMHISKRECVNIFVRMYICELGCFCDV